MKPEDLDIKDSVIFVKRDPTIRMTIAELVGPAGGEGPIITQPEMGRGAQRSNFTEPLFAYGWQVQQGAYASARLRLAGRRISWKSRLTRRQARWKSSEL